MIDILSPGLALAVAVLAVLVPVGVGVVAAIRGRGLSTPRRIGRGIGTFLVVVLCQALGLVAVFLHVNNTYAFYTSWEELLGEAPAAPTHDLVAIASPSIKKVPITTRNPHPDGMLAGIEVPGTDRAYSHVPVWLPPQYFEKSEARTRFPVLYWIGGVNDTGDHDLQSIPLVGPASTLVKSAKVNPFVIVFLPGKIRAGQDTECTDIGGINHQSWIMRTVRDRIEKHYRVGRTRDSRFVAGWSTGGYCAANLTSKYPNDFKAGFGLAPYYHPTFEGATLAKVTPRIVADNSPLARVKAGKVDSRVRFLSVMSKLDRSTWGDASNPVVENGQVWADGQDFWNHAHTLKQYEFILLPSGGHGTATYIPYLSQCLRWLGQYGL
ncbi:alpha/beta hydrolase [Acidipropionibacterium timonense]|uniref:alpha/beta hydrolase n=1 Tax=Acidipropionibacterium timonense TaxID=2161818 RepID=UPI001FD881A4|nr:alpha/beta hydrolase-fold protein [Acidipropionibacterium timonense]